MRLMARQLVIPWPDAIPASGLRAWVLENIRIQAEPLRWAITSIDPSPEGSRTALEVEAVLINA